MNFELSFESLREGIFQGILDSLGKGGLSYIHAAIFSGYDPRQLISPDPRDAVLMSQYGQLSLQFDIPGQLPIQLSIILTMGRLSYSILLPKSVVETARMQENLPCVASELGMKCDFREIGNTVRFEFCNEPSLVWSSTTISILNTRQLENAFKEFVILQGDRLIIGISNLLAAYGYQRESGSGNFAIVSIRDCYDTSAFEHLLENSFNIVSVDSRDNGNKLFGVVTKSNNLISFIDYYKSLETEYEEKGYKVVIRHTLKHEMANNK